MAVLDAPVSCHVGADLLAPATTMYQAVDKPVLLSRTAPDRVRVVTVRGPPSDSLKSAGLEIQRGALQVEGSMN